MFILEIIEIEIFLWCLFFTILYIFIFYYDYFCKFEIFIFIKIYNNFYIITIFKIFKKIIFFKMFIIYIIFILFFVLFNYIIFFNNNIFFFIKLNLIIPDLIFFFSTFIYFLFALYDSKKLIFKNNIIDFDFIKFSYNKGKYYCIILIYILLFTAGYQFLIGIKFSFIYFYFIIKPLNLSLFFNSIILSPLIIKIKSFLTLILCFILYITQYYIKLSKVYSFEYFFILSWALIASWVIISSKQWLLFYLSLELQTLCLLIVISWNRNNENSIIATLKYSIVSLLASFFILYAIIRLTLLTANVNIYFNFYFLISSLCQRRVPFGKFILDPHNYYIDNFDYTYLFYLILIFLGLIIKLGTAPIASWVPEIYEGIPLPSLIFFSTLPKFIYVFIISYLIGYHSFLFILNKTPSYIFIFFALCSVTVGAFGLLNERRNIFRFLGWSSILNLGILFLIFSFTGINIQLCLRLSITYIIIYIINIIFYLSLIFCLYFPDEQYVLYNEEYNLNSYKGRFAIYISDLQVLGRSNIFILYFIIICCLFSFFGLPPFLGFWSKFIVIKGILSFICFNYLNYYILFYVIFISIIGGFGYIQIIYVIISEITNESISIILEPIQNYLDFKLLFIFVIINFIIVFNFNGFIYLFSSYTLDLSLNLEIDDYYIYALIICYGNYVYF
jgi:NADH-quinone oxidoreductase subunit N